MAKILIVWELGGGTGHCVNLLPVVKGLLSKGHRIYAAVRDLHIARSVFGDLSIDYFQAPIQRTRPLESVDQVRTFAQMLHNVGFGNEEQLDALIHAWRNLLDLINPAAMICEHSPTALLASRLYDVTRVVMGTGFFCPPDVSPLPPFLPPLMPDLGGSASDEDMILRRMNTVLQRGAQPEMERVSQLYADVDENFLFTFAELDHYPQRKGAHYWGMWSPPGGVNPQWPEAKGPRIYAYLQPPAARWHPSAVLSALREVGAPSLVYTPAVDPNFLSRFAAPNIAFETRRLDMAQLCRQCNAAITHGNNGTVTQLLLGGIPQLHLPLFVEQEVFRRRVCELGAALTAEIDNSYHVAVQLGSLLEREQYTAAAKSFARKYEHFDSEVSMEEIVTRIDALFR